MSQLVSNAFGILFIIDAFVSSRVCRRLGRRCMTIFNGSSNVIHGAFPKGRGEQWRRQSGVLCVVRTCSVGSVWMSFDGSARRRPDDATAATAVYGCDECGRPHTKQHKAKCCSCHLATGLLFVRLATCSTRPVDRRTCG
jgi:hypothetical protein